MPKFILYSKRFWASGLAIVFAVLQAAGFEIQPEWGDQANTAFNAVITGVGTLVALASTIRGSKPLTTDPKAGG